MNRRRFIKTAGTGALLAIPLIKTACKSGPDFDLIIVGGHILDGSGKRGFQGDIGILADRIVAIGDLKDRSARQKIDANGLTVAPGFIDFHSHSDDELLLGGTAQSKIRQGVTLEILGQDGGSMAPLNQRMQKTLHASLKRRYKIDTGWADFAGYYQALEKDGMISNALSMIGQGTLRDYVVGQEDRPATDTEINEMIQLAQTAIAHGAYGISSGLEYTPGSFANTREIIELCKAMNGKGIYSTHMRNEDDTVIEAIEEAILIAAEAGVDLNISHMKASGRRNWPKLAEMLKRMDAARADGMQVTCDRYPYIAYNTDLSSLFPLWSREGGRKAFVERLQDNSLEADIRAAVENKVTKIGGWHSVMVSSVPNHKARKTMEGKRIDELAANSDPYHYLANLIVKEKGGGEMVGFAMSEENTSSLMAYSHCMIASDASSLAEEGVLRRGNPHPRSYGTFPRILGKYSRDDKLISLAEAVRKISALPADTLHLRDRGYIAKNYYADIVAFDAANVIDLATWSNPHQYPKGIQYVLVNGQVVIDKEKFTGNLPGRVIRYGKS